MLRLFAFLKPGFDAQTVLYAVESIGHFKNVKIMGLYKFPFKNENLGQSINNVDGSE